ncbi:hypothetical protein PAN31117_03594 [Pandoraea anapnoica]|uniref:Uncharacterized protein n=1 Tax=Pandoraea anapnoica TaxID=2508301 RepID=A0A5E5ACE2_9BURK|nr:hypothetical protein [Pandoraea anapnoica]VVE70215.1 hypothetical protein PAN31117_03594 [Pandoraea anapnoica]
MTVKRKALLRTDNKAASLNVRAKRASTEESPSPKVGPPAPEIDPDVLADRGDIPEENFPFNPVLANLEGQPIDFTAPILPNYTTGYVYRYFVDGTTDTVEGSITDQDIEDGIFTIAVEPELLTHGIHTLTYATRPQFDPGFSDPSEPTYFTLDFEPPYNLGEGEVPTEVDDGLTDEILTALGDVLPLTLPGWGDQAFGDVIVGIVRQVGGPNHMTAPLRIPFGHDWKETVTLEFPRAIIEAAGDGILEFTYTITDLAGNESEEAFIKLVDVFVSGGIDDLEPPIVPAQEEDGLITEEDARAPVVVQIPGHTSVEPGFVIVVLWGSQALEGVVFDGDNDDEIMLEVDVPYEIVSSEWDANKDAGGYADIDVNYVVYGAGSREVGRPDTPTSVRVNLNQAGGVDPDPDTPENEALGKPVVRHSAWEAGDQEDFIPDASIETNHAIVIPWFVRDELGNVTDEDAFRAGDEINFVYNGDPAGSYEVVAADVTAQIDLVKPLEWEPVKAGGSGQRDVQYIVERTLPPGTEVNTSLSPVTVVTVMDAGDLPGGSDPLPEAAFNDPVITWKMVDQDYGGFAPLTIPVYENQKLNDVVRIHVLCNRWVAGGPDLEELPLAEYGGPEGANEVAAFPFEQVITATNIGKPLTFAWPQEVLVNAYHLARARVAYRVTRGGDDTAFKDADAGARSIIELGNMPQPPARAGMNAPASRHRPTLAEALAGVEHSAAARRAALRTYVRAWRTTSAQRRAYLEFKKEREARLLKAIKLEHRIDDPYRRKLAEIAARPTPDPFKKE